MGLGGAAEIEDPAAREGGVDVAGAAMSHHVPAKCLVVVFGRVGLSPFHLRRDPGGVEPRRDLAFAFGALQCDVVAIRQE